MEEEKKEELVEENSSEKTKISPLKPIDNKPKSPFTNGNHFGNNRANNMNNNRQRPGRAASRGR